jgi:hypothetical protein
MRPTRECTLVDLLDKILDKGVLINADVIISVAGVPLIGLNLRAALAGMETMLDYGMMEAWDKSVREYYAKEFAKKQVPLDAGEEVILQAFGSHWYSEGVYHAWRHGYLYLTNKRLFLFRKEPASEILFEAPLGEIGGLAIRKGMHVGRERDELYMSLNEGGVARVCTEDLMGLKKAIEKIGVPGEPIAVQAV